MKIKKYSAFLLVLLWANSNYSVEEKNISGFPTFPIYANKTAIYATLSGSFSINPEYEIHKAERFSKDNNKSNITSLTSSYLTIKFDEKIYQFSELDNIKSEWNLEDQSISIYGKIPEINAEVFFILKNKNSQKNSFFITYKAVNHTNRIIDIGFRNLIDLGSDLDEEISLKASLSNPNEKEIYKHEYKFTPFQSGYWESFENESSNYKGIRNYLTGNGNIPPDKIAFVNWERAFTSSWKYFTNKNRPIHNNPAVLLWWNPRPIKQNESLEISTEFEMKTKKSGINFELLDPDSGNGRLYLNFKNNSDVKKEISYLLEPSANSLLSLNFVNPLKFTVEKESNLNQIYPVTIHGKGDVSLLIKEINGTAESNHKLPIKLSSGNREQSPKFWKSSKYPIIYNSDKDGLKLKGIVRAKDTGKKLGESELISVKTVQNNFVYLGEVDLLEFNGEVVVEIFKQ